MQNQNNVEIVDPKTGVAVTPQAVIVEDSVTHQSGDGITTGMSPSMETPDIFDNTPQAVVKIQSAEDVANGELSDENVARISEEEAQKLQQTAQANLNAENSLHTLSDGSVDIDRDH